MRLVLEQGLRAPCGSRCHPYWWITGSGVRGGSPRPPYCYPSTHQHFHPLGPCCCCHTHVLSPYPLSSDLANPVACPQTPSSVTLHSFRPWWTPPCLNTSASLSLASMAQLPPVLFPPLVISHLSLLVFLPLTTFYMLGFQWSSSSRWSIIPS